MSRVISIRIMDATYEAMGKLKTYNIRAAEILKSKGEEAVLERLHKLENDIKLNKQPGDPDWLYD